MQLKTTWATYTTLSATHAPRYLRILLKGTHVLRRPCYNSKYFEVSCFQFNHESNHSFRTFLTSIDSGRYFLIVSARHLKIKKFGMKHRFNLGSIGLIGMISSDSMISSFHGNVRFFRLNSTTLVLTT